MAEKIKQQIANGQYVEATDTWSALEDVIDNNSNSVVAAISSNWFLDFDIVFVGVLIE